MSKERLIVHEINAYYLLRRKIIIIAIHHVTIMTNCILPMSVGTFYSTWRMFANWSREWLYYRTAVGVFYFSIKIVVILTVHDYYSHWVGKLYNYTILHYKYKWRRVMRQVSSYAYRDAELQHSSIEKYFFLVQI